MSDLLWTPLSGSTPQPIGCNGYQLILALTKASQPWEKLDIIDATLKKCGLDPFFDVLDIPNEGILGSDIPESARRGHENSLIRALAIQAFGKIPNLVKKSEIAALNNYVSRNLLTVLKQEAGHGETTLIRWSANIAIRSIWYDEEWQKQGKYYSVNAGIDAPRLEQRIIEEQVKPLISNRPIQRYNYTGGFSTDYQDYLEFWAYGPIWELFSLPCNSEDYKFLVDEILEQLQARGVSYGLAASNSLVIEKSLEIANRIFDQFNFSQIITKLSKFLQHGEARVRDKAVEMLKPYKNQLDKKPLSILEALIFDFYLEKLILESLSILELERIILSTNNYQEEIEEIFSEALSSCDMKAHGIRDFLQNRLNYYKNNINEYSNRLLKQLNELKSSRKLITEKIDILSSILADIEKIDRELFSKLSSQNKTIITVVAFDNNTYENCQKINNELNLIKISVQSILGQATSHLSAKIRKSKQNHSNLLEKANSCGRNFLTSIWVWLSGGIGLAFLWFPVTFITFGYGTKLIDILWIYWSYLCIIIGVVNIIIAMALYIIAASISTMEETASGTNDKCNKLIEVQNKLYSQWKG